MFLCSKGIIERILLRSTLNDTLEFASSEPFHENTVVENIFKYQEKDKYLETQKANHYLIFGFKNLSVTLEAYKIRSINEEFASHLKSWYFYGSNNLIDWEVLDHVPNDSQLNGSLNTAVYHIPEKKGPYRYFKLSNVTTYLHVNKILIADFDVYDTFLSPLLYCSFTLHHSNHFSLRQFHIFVLVALI